MAYLSNYLGSSGGRVGRPRYSYSSTRQYSPYSVSRRGTASDSGASMPFSQDLSSALLQQRQISKMSAPSSDFSSNFDYDPILSKIQALSSQTVANATTNAAQLRNQALIQSGAFDIGKSLGFNPDILSAAQQNPESDWAQLQKEYARRQQDLIESESAQNLLYSGDYVRQLNELSQGRASAEGTIGQRLRDMLSGIDTNLLSAQETARQQELDAAAQAAIARNYAEFGFTGAGSVVDGLEIPFNISGYSPEEISAAAQASAPAGQIAHMVMQEGHIEFRNGTPGIYIKYLDPNGGGNTIWVPLPKRPDPTTQAAPPPPNAGPTPVVTTNGIQYYTNPATTDPLAVYLGGGTTSHGLQE